MKIVFSKACFVMLATLTAAMMLSGCKKDKNDDNPTEDVDKTRLQTLIIECQALLDDATTVDYPQANITAFENAVYDAETVRDNQFATQQQVDLTYNNLTLAKNVFIESRYEDVPDSSVIAYFSFDELEDNTVASTGTSPVVGVLNPGPAEIFGEDTSLPMLVEGVNGGNALYFSQGNYVAVENYNPADFLMNNMSWSVWVKVDDASRTNNYVFSLNYWNNWKLNIENNGKPFFTVNTTSGIVDMDNEAVGTVVDDTWVHLAITMDLNTDTIVFYVNGVESKTWNSSTKENLTGSIAAPYQSPLDRQLPLLIGAATIYEEALTWTWDSWNSPESWDSMVGAIDNLAIYNSTLTAGQIARIYQQQMPQ